MKIGKIFQKVSASQLKVSEKLKRKSKIRVGHVVEKGRKFRVLIQKRFGRPDNEPDGVSLDPGDFRRVIVGVLDRPQKGFLPEIFQIAARNPLLDPDRVDQARILQQESGSWG